MVTEPKSPLEQALDLVFYAPVGLAITAREELPRLIEKGRERITGQVTMARMLGQFAVNQGQKEAGKAVKQAADALTGLGILPGESHPATPTTATRSPGSVAPAPPPTPTPPASPASTNGNATGRAEPAPSSEGLAIPGYDALSASQVVQRLAGLAAGELEAVREYETTTRGRRTVLSKIAQLQTGAG